MDRNSIILSHSGKQHSYYVGKAMHDLGYLKTFYTSSYITSPALQQLVSKMGWHFWSRRFMPGLGGNQVNASWGYEVKELLYRKLKGNSAKVNELVFERDVSFDKDLSRKLTSLQYDMFWGFQGSCLNCLDTANRMGKKSVCEMTIAHVPFAKQLLNEECIQHPEWRDSIDFNTFPSTYEQRLIEEPHKASKVIAISQFLKTTLLKEGIDADKIQVIPLGFDAASVTFNTETPSIENRPLRLLYAGKITQRKGILYLLEAMKRFDKKDVELYIIGNIYGKGEAFSRYKDYYNFSPGISQIELFKRYADYDVLVFPSLLEGFGLVTVEAMGAGLPVITTANTNATEVLQHGKNGYLVPIRSADAISNAIANIRSMDNATFQSMRHNARQTALQYTWDVYQQKLASFIHTL